MMLRKILSAILAVTIVFSLVACGGTSDEDKIKIGMVTDTGGVNDGSFNQSSWAGLQRAQKELGIEVKYLESKTDADYAANIETFMDEGCDLILGVGFMLAGAIGEAAVAYPEQKFAIIDDNTNAGLPNVACIIYKQEQSSYLVGYAAGLMTQTDRVGFILGKSSDIMNMFGYGYVAGVLDANPDAKIEMGNVNSFVDSGQGKTLATNMITRGADVLFHAAGSTGLGMIEACKEANVKAIGVDLDQSVLAPQNIITSAIKRVDLASFEISKAIVENTFKGGTIIYDLSSEGVDYVASDLLPDDVKTTLEDIKEKMIAGEIVVPNNKADFEAKYGDVYTLD